VTINGKGRTLYSRPNATEDEIIASWQFFEMIKYYVGKNYQIYWTPRDGETTTIDPTKEQPKNLTFYAIKKTVELTVKIVVRGEVELRLPKSIGRRALVIRTADTWNESTGTWTKLSLESKTVIRHAIKLGYELKTSGGLVGHLQP